MPEADKLYSTYLLIIAGIAALILSSCSYYPEWENEDLLSEDNLKYYTLGNLEDAEKGIIFYPGGLVDPYAYLPMLNQWLTEDLTIFVAKAPFNLAVIQPGAALPIMEKYPHILSWTIAGHSLGGSMAASVVGKSPERFDHLILLASYPAQNTELKSFQGRVLSMYGSDDGVLDLDKVENSKEFFANIREITTPEEIDDNRPLAYFIQIEGGNHAYFGHYGEQRGDGIARISREEQQIITAGFIQKLLQ